ncbi:MAG: ammonium transporter [Verrucomicrobia bacterium]|nr:ammonium transporter [Verrucomicrobiota bacterium]
MNKILLIFAFLLLAQFQVSQGQDSSPKIEAKLDTIIQKLDASQTTLNSVAAKIGGETAPVAAAPAPDAGTTAVKADIEAVQMNVNYIWMILTGALVFVMQAGFAMVELGFARAKNSINIIMKNFLDFCISAIVFLFLGFGLMFGTSLGGWIGIDSFWISDRAGDDKLWCFWFFQVVFAGTACTIVSGAMAERTKFVGYLVYAALLAAIVYPIGGHWAWGSFGGAYGVGGSKGWLEALGFVDFAGSTVVHGCGGACALAGILVVGARHGRFGKDGSPRLIAGHNIPIAALGVFLLWFGWFGFNAGSTLIANASIGRIAVNTTIAPAAAALAAMISMWFVQGRPDVGITLNGSLGGAVGVTACCANISPASALIVGLIAGIITTVATIALERLKIDDAVGAVPVHLCNGWWGTLCVALFDEKAFSAHKLGVQALGTFSVTLTSFVICFGIFKLVDLTVGLRATDEEQVDGLDFSEHAANAYPDFQTTEQS